MFEHMATILHCIGTRAFAVLLTLELNLGTGFLLLHCALVYSILVRAWAQLCACSSSSSPSMPSFFFFFAQSEVSSNYKPVSPTFTFNSLHIFTLLILAKGCLCCLWAKTITRHLELLKRQKMRGICWPLVSMCVPCFNKSNYFNFQPLCSSKCPLLTSASCCLSLLLPPPPPRLLLLIWGQVSPILFSSFLTI